MIEEEITLEQLLEGRDTRAAFQRELLERYQLPLVSFTVNMPGTVKRCSRSERIHEAGVAAIRDALAGHVAYWKLRDPVTGPEGFFACDLPAEELKRRMCALEEEHPLGRLFDIDVLCAPGEQISREALGFPKRKCLICGGDGAACTRSRAHPLPELLMKIDALLSEYQI
ncbi:MAG: citrate lyase holo-[acyl-carrier protein] synthase [Clostridiaceae bacterium]|nr:citrate lyase holo-[acyl-carrier protein] synthase [Clostridiaceae bacterium]